MRELLLYVRTLYLQPTTNHPYSEGWRDACKDIQDEIERVLWEDRGEYVEEDED